jgi:HAD superfamily hydrolase (TIGR01509 family)
MIKAVLFDMDGVLIDAKDWHYEALNDALRLFGMEISRSDHLSSFDGLPTKKKLEILSQTQGLPRALHGFINEIKQRRTYELTIERCRPMFHHQYALSRLRREGMKIGVCSNSISVTIATMMKSSALEEYLDFFISNQDVANAKPHPEMYIKGIERCGVQPHETIIVEDNDHGIQAARASGAHVLEVQTVYDVTYERIRAMIDMIEAAQ